MNHALPYRNYDNERLYDLARQSSVDELESYVETGELPESFGETHPVLSEEDSETLLDISERLIKERERLSLKPLP